MLGIRLVGALCSGGNCSGAHGNSRREGNRLHLDGVFLVNTVVTVNVHFRFALCFTLCVFGLSRKKKPEVKTIKNFCRECLVLSNYL